jgi:hypothetical protein
MERMLCTKCAAVSYSAAAAKLVEGGQRCEHCGAPLALDAGAHDPARKPPSPTART